MPLTVRALKLGASPTEFLELNSNLKSFIRLIVNRGTSETRYQILPGQSVHIKQSPINGNSHITKEHKSLGGKKTNFIIEVKQKVHLSITTFTSLENKTDGLKTTEVPRL